MTAPGRPTDNGITAVVDRASATRTPDELLRDAWAVRRLLDDLADEEHHLRMRLLLARDELRREAARQWRRRGWRPITDQF